MIVFLFPVVTMIIGYFYSEILTGTDREYYLLIIEGFKLYSLKYSLVSLEPFFAFITFLAARLPFSLETILNLLMFLSLLIKSYAFNRIIVNPNQFQKFLLLILFSLLYGFCLYNRQELGSLRQAFSVGFIMLYFCENNKKRRINWSILALLSHYSMGVLLFSFIAVDSLIISRLNQTLIQSIRSSFVTAVRRLKTKNLFSLSFRFKAKYLLLIIFPFVILLASRGHLIQYSLGSVESINSSRFYSISIFSYYRFYTYSLPPLILILLNNNRSLLHESLNTFFARSYLNISVFVSLLSLILSTLPLASVVFRLTLALMPLSLLFACYLVNNSFNAHRIAEKAIYLKLNYIGVALPIFFTVSLLGYKYFINPESIYQNQLL